MGGLLVAFPMVVLVQLISGLAVGLYLGRWRFGSFDEVAALSGSALTATLALFLIDMEVVQPRMVPAGAVLEAGFLALVMMAGARYIWRLFLERRQRPQGDAVARLMIFGAGEAGAQVVTSLLRDPDSPYVPVALLDDDRSKHNRRILGVRVMGNRAQLAATAKVSAGRHHADHHIQGRRRVGQRALRPGPRGRIGREGPSSSRRDIPRPRSGRRHP